MKFKGKIRVTKAYSQSQIRKIDKDRATRAICTTVGLCQERVK